MLDLIFLIVAGLLAGGLGGLLGIGGGVVLMPILRFAVGMTAAQSAGTCVVAVFFTSLGGGFKHYRLGHVSFRPLLPVIITGATSATIFSMLFLAVARAGAYLDLGIGLIFLALSLRMIADGWRGEAKSETDAETKLDGRLGWKCLLGMVSGVLPGLFGIGTGAVLVPGFTYLLKTPIKTAIGSALVCFAVNAFISAGFKFSQGYVSLAVAAPVCLGTIVGSQFGAVINHYAPQNWLRIFFGLAFSLVSWRFLESGLEVFK